MSVGLAESGIPLATTARARAARRTLTDALLLGLLADLLLRTFPDGLGWTLWVVTLALAAVDVARSRTLDLGREPRAWLGTAVACAAAFAWRDAQALRLANILGTLVSLAMFGMAATGLPAPSILAARLRDVITGGLFTIRDILTGAPPLLLRDAELGTLPAPSAGTPTTALRALLVTAPLVVVFTLLLSRADPVFASLFSLPEIDVGQLVGHLLLIGAFAWWSAGLIRGAILGVARRATPPEQLPLRLGRAEITTSLGAVIVLFAVFVALQLRWLFGGADVVLATTGLTLAEYARRGFFELVAVAVLVVPLILGTRALAADDQVLARHRQLSLALLLLLAAIMASALLRMRLYIGYFGLTTDRLFATAIMTWLAIVCAAMAVTVLRDRPRAFAAATVLSAFAILAALNVANPELLVARVNLSRPAAVRELDYGYLARLNGDAIPSVVRALNAATPSEASCNAARRLRRRWLRSRDTAWNLGQWRGRQAVVEQLPPQAVLRLCVTR